MIGGPACDQSRMWSKPPCVYVYICTYRIFIYVYIYITIYTYIYIYEYIYIYIYVPVLSSQSLNGQASPMEQHSSQNTYILNDVYEKVMSKLDLEQHFTQDFRVSDVWEQFWKPEM